MDYNSLRFLLSIKLYIPKLTRLTDQRTDSPKSLLACKVLMECCVSSMQTQYMQRR